MSLAFRLLRSGSAHPAWNMAVDEALLERYVEGDPPILRLYGWEPAALSLGRFQRAADVDLPEGAVLVRRLSGGSAIYHQRDEVTYALVGAYADLGRRPRAAYALVHGVIEQALRRLGVALAPRTRSEERAGTEGLCFAKATDYDLVVGAAKLVGSAQRRRGHCFLQHGSIPLSPDPRVSTSTAVNDLLARPVTRDDVEAAVVESLLASVAREAHHDALRETEVALATELQRSRYANSRWTEAR